MARKPRQVSLNDIFVLFAISLGLAIWDWQGNEDYAHLAAVGTRTTALVFDYNSRNYSTPYTLEFRLPDGKTQRAQVGAGSGGQVGQTIEIYYDPNAPYRVVKVGAISHNLLWAAAFFAAFGCFGIWLKKDKIPF